MTNEFAFNNEVLHQMYSLLLNIIILINVSLVLHVERFIKEHNLWDVAVGIHSEIVSFLFKYI